MTPKITYARGKEEILNTHTVTFQDQAGNEFRVSFSRQEGGITVNKVTNNGNSEQIIIHPTVTNEVEIL